MLIKANGQYGKKNDNEDSTIGVKFQNLLQYIRLELSRR